MNPEPSSWMGRIRKWKPIFFDRFSSKKAPYGPRFNFRKIWELTVCLGCFVTIVPLLIMAAIDYRVSQQAMESEILLRTSRLASNTRRSITYFLIERKAAIDFVIQNDPYEALRDPNRLEQVLSHLKNSFGGFVDLGVIDDRGIQITYAGPYALQGKQYSEAGWFIEAVRKGISISDVFMGYRNIPHMVIAVKHERPNDGFFMLRATVDMEKLNDLLAGLEVGGDGDAFLVNRQGILQTPSRNHGKVLDPINLPLPPYSERTQVEEVSGYSEGPLVIGFAYITPETPFILMIVKEKNRLMESWKKSRLEVTGFLLVSILVIVAVVLGGSTYLINEIYLSDERRLEAVHKVEYANKMASLGRLSAGVAHEINNPLAIISEKAGLIRDLLLFQEKYGKDPKLIGLIDSVLSSVDRCAGITRRLLNFARHSEFKPVSLDPKEVILEVLGFVGKEAEYRSIEVTVDKDEDVPDIVSDRGSLQEIFLNLTTNALAAVSDGGRLSITVKTEGPDAVKIFFSDNGHGIPAADLDRIFEPFFSTKLGKGGTGLGLSITYGLVQDLGGRLSVESQVGVGTTFIITFPVKCKASSNRATFRAGR